MAVFLEVNLFTKVIVIHSENSTCVPAEQVSKGNLAGKVYWEGPISSKEEIDLVSLKEKFSHPPRPCSKCKPVIRQTVTEQTNDPTEQ